MACTAASSRRPLKLAALALLALLFCGALLPGASRLRFDNYHWLPPGNPIREAKSYLDREFQRGEELVVLIRPSRDYFSAAVLDEIDRVQRALTGLDEVSSVDSPLHVQLTIADRDGSLSITPYRRALERGLLADIPAYRDHLRASDYWGQLIAEDASAIALVVKLDIDFDAWNFPVRARVLDEAARLLEETQFLRDYQFAGETELIQRLDLASSANLRLLLPLVALLAFLILLLAYRSLLKSLIVAAAAAGTLLVSLNVIVCFDHPINVVSLSLPVLIIVIAIADSIHVIARWQQIGRQQQGSERILEALRQTWLPCLITSLTTAVGFGVFHFSELIPLSHFGWDAFFSILLAYPVILGSTLASLYAFGPSLQRRSERQEQRQGRGSGRMAAFTAALQRRPLAIAAACLGVSLIFVYGFRHLHTETNFLDVFFKKSSPTYKAFEFMDARLGGSGGVDLILQRADGGPEAFKNIDEFRRVEALAAEFAELPQVNFANSYLLPVALVYREFDDSGDRDPHCWPNSSRCWHREPDGDKYPQRQDALSQVLLFIEFSRSDQQSDVLAPYVDFTYENSRMRLQTDNLSSSQTERLVREEILPRLEKHSLATYLLTGASYYFQALSDYVLETQVQSFLLCFACVWLFFTLAFGLRLGLVGMATTLLPLGIALGAIPLAGFPFDFASVLIASTSTGLSVDNSIHYLHQYRRRRLQGQTRAEALCRSSEALQGPILLTSALLVTGFAVFLASDLVVMIRFGAFSALAISAALVSTFVFLPCALACTGRHQGDSG